MKGLQFLKTIGTTVTTLYKVPKLTSPLYIYRVEGLIFIFCKDLKHVYWKRSHEDFSHLVSSLSEIYVFIKNIKFMQHWPMFVWVKFLFDQRMSFKLICPEPRANG